jgi:hypothetical protein
MHNRMLMLPSRREVQLREVNLCCHMSLIVNIRVGASIAKLLLLLHPSEFGCIQSTAP